jgi:hypothetical protein
MTIADTPPFGQGLLFWRDISMMMKRDVPN